MALAHQGIADDYGVPGNGGGVTGRGHRGGHRRGPRRSAGPRVTHSVATTTASGVTVTTTTQTVKGKTVVTRVRHAPAGGDS